MNSSFATIGAGNPWPRFKPCSASGPDGSPRHTSTYEAAQIFQRPPAKNTIYRGLLKQPDKQKLAKGRCENRFPWKAPTATGKLLNSTNILILLLLGICSNRAYRLGSDR